MKIALLGDVGLFGKFCVKNGIKAEEYFSKFLSKTKDCDFIVGNLETPFTNDFKEYSAKSAYIGSRKENVELVKALNISHVNLANNHTGDFGLEGYELTKKILRDYDIKYFGVEGINEYLEFNGSRICFSGFCNMDSNPVLISDPNKANDIGVNIVDVDNVFETLSKSSKAGYLNILAYHSGLEHINLPGKPDVCYARYLADNFDYVLYGHHPHVVQAYERVKKSYLFYSLGNFCFDDVYSDASKEPLVKMSEANKLGLVPILTIENSKVVEVEYLWTYLGLDKMEVINPETNTIVDSLKKIDLSDLDEIEAERKQLLNKLFLKRKRKRNINWYLSRFRIKYVKLFLNSKRNRKLYEKHYLNKLRNFRLI